MPGRDPLVPLQRGAYRTNLWSGQSPRLCNLPDNPCRLPIFCSRKDNGPARMASPPNPARHPLLLLPAEILFLLFLKPFHRYTADENQARNFRCVEVEQTLSPRAMIRASFSPRWSDSIPWTAFDLIHVSPLGVFQFLSREL